MAEATTLPKPVPRFEQVRVCHDCPVCGRCVDTYRTTTTYDSIDIRKVAHVERKFEPCGCVIEGDSNGE